MKLLASITAATYLLAGIAKLRIGGLAWLDGHVLREQIAVDNARKALLGDGVAVLARTMIEQPALLGVLAVGTMAIELGAPLALVGGRLGRCWAAAAWAFHLGVVLAMNVWFPYPLAGPGLLPLFEVERGVVRVRAGLQRVTVARREWLRSRSG